jgi:hypothetical protein
MAKDRKQYLVYPTETEREQREFLLRSRRPGGHLDGYVFSSKEHAQSWIKQPGAQDDYYLVSATVVRSRCCGATVALRGERPEAMPPATERIVT